MIVICYCRFIRLRVCEVESGSCPDEVDAQAGLHWIEFVNATQQIRCRARPTETKEALIRGLFFCLKDDIKSFIQEETDLISFRLNIVFKH